VAAFQLAGLHSTECIHEDATPTYTPRPPIRTIMTPVPIFVTLFVFRVDAVHVSAYECLGECEWYVGEVTVERARLPRVRPGERVRIRVA
jgi:hypothetical protein